MSTFYIRKGNRRPYIGAVLKDSEGNIADLTGATVKFIMSATPGGSDKVNAAASIVGLPTAGTVQYAWGATDTNEVGVFYAEFCATYGVEDESFPNHEYILVEITEQP